MASSTPDPDRLKLNPSLNPSGKVRVIAKIRNFTNQESESLKGGSTPWISVRKPNKDGLSDRVTISFGDQPASRKEAYEMDYCYEQNEDIVQIFSREIKPLISWVFDGHNASIIAYGARGSGKTYSIQGSEEKPGLAALAMDEILSMAEKVGQSVAVSVYEVFHDHAYDLLDSKHPEVQVLEDAQGKIQLKGLSQVSVTSISEFYKLYFNGCGSRNKPAQKIPLELPRRSHKGLIMQISSHNENSNSKLVGKMNFVDLAGYEDSRRNSSDGINAVESARINKSLYALLNVVCALNANDIRVPYRGSKLTRMLQDSLGGRNHVLMLTCLNPSFCQDTICTVSLASRSCQATYRVFTDSTKKIKSSAKSTVVSSLKNGKPATLSTSVKKRVQFSEKKASYMEKGRKLFEEGNQLMSSQQERLISDVSPATVPQKEEVETLAPAVDNAVEPFMRPQDISPCRNSNHSEVNSAVNNTLFEDGDGVEKENKNLVIYEDGSPPLSARLQELSNNLKSLYSSTPLCIKMPQEVDTPSSGQVVCTDIVEPKTPVIEQDVRVNDKWEVAKFNSPWETFNQRSSGMKHSLVQEYLKFLNTASKEELKGLRGIGEKRATYILELREESPEPFKSLENLQDIGLSAKQIKGMMRKIAGELFN